MTVTRLEGVPQCETDPKALGLVPQRLGMDVRHLSLVELIGLFDRQYPAGKERSESQLRKGDELGVLCRRIAQEIDKTLNGVVAGVGSLDRTHLGSRHRQIPWHKQSSLVVAE